MNDEILTKIAEFDGAKYRKIGQIKCALTFWNEYPETTKTEKSIICVDVRNKYLRLESVNNVLCKLSRSQKIKFASNLMEQTRWYPIGTAPNWDNDRYSLFGICNATAEEKLNALYKTLCQ